MLTRVTSPGALLWWLSIWLSGMLTYEYYDRVEAPAMAKRIAIHHEIVTGSAPYQYRYRILLPYTAEAVGRVLQQLPGVGSSPATEPLSYSKRAFALAYCLLNMTALCIMLASLGKLIWQFFAYHFALLGVAVSAFLVNFTFRDQYFHPWSFWEGAFFALGLLLIHRKQYWLFSGISLLGLLNRETSIFLLLAFLFYTLPQERSMDALRKALKTRDMRFALANLLVWVPGLLLLHQVLGYRPSTFFIETAVNGNRERFKDALLLNFLLMGFVWPLVMRGMRLSPLLIRRAALMLPAYFGLLLVIGFWWEIRYWITILPIVIPALIAAIASATAGDPRYLSGIGSQIDASCSTKPSIGASPST